MRRFGYFGGSQNEEGVLLLHNNTPMRRIHLVPLIWGVVARKKERFYLFGVCVFVFFFFAFFVCVFIFSSSFVGVCRLCIVGAEVVHYSTTTGVDSREYPLILFLSIKCCRLGTRSVADVLHIYTTQKFKNTNT